MNMRATPNQTNDTGMRKAAAPNRNMAYPAMVAPIGPMMFIAGSFGGFLVANATQGRKSSGV
jgi:hypothetical protein